MAEEVARNCLTAEEWAEAELSRREHRVVPIAGRPGKMLVHGHCHQKALGGLPALKKLLGRIPGSDIVDPDAGCCGMAGSFGYEKEHYEVSRSAGERRLFPAIRKADPDTVVVAPGFSCRQQIGHFTEARAVSAIEVLAPLVRRSIRSERPDSGDVPPADEAQGGSDVD